MLLLVGLGNPGDKYADNRHNIGFMAVDEIIRRHGFAPPRRRFQGLTSEGTMAGQKVMVLKPMTFMNESGRSVGEAARFFKIDADHIVVFHDELDLAPGKLRVKNGGGLAGHNGLKSLAAHIGRDFRRVRLGVGHPGHKDKVLRYVLQNFAKADDTWLDPLLDAMAEAAPLLTSGDDAAFASKVALILKPPEHRPRPLPAASNTDENQSTD
ncbi:MAG: aminoacyl-tRNA hydrolase [Alphaproteobacteria bacterium]|nr:aminoacyl-tRNA hydrolase [Alphaproteobacteria bacterium]